MAIGRWSALSMLALLLLMFAAFQIRDRQIRPLEMRAKAARWVLTTAWMMEAYHQRHGVYRPCGGPAEPCLRLLGWQSTPYRLRGYQLQVEVIGSSYRVEAIGARGRWVLDAGTSIRWEGAVLDLERPSWLSLEWLEEPQ
jgi:hypothetical protein